MALTQVQRGFIQDGAVTMANLYTSNTGTSEYFLRGDGVWAEAYPFPTSSLTLATLTITNAIKFNDGSSISGANGLTVTYNNILNISNSAGPSLNIRVGRNAGLNNVTTGTVWEDGQVVPSQPNDNNGIAIGPGAADSNPQTGGAIALGAETQTPGYAGIAIGRLTEANGDYSIAQGFRTEANGDSSIAIGKGAVANSSNGIALGFALSQFNGSIAIGNAAGGNSPPGTAISGEYSIAIGTGAGTKFGTGTKLTNEYSVSLGYRAGGLGQNPNAIAIGANAMWGNLANTINNGQAENTIIINATGEELDWDYAANGNAYPEARTNSLYITPIRASTTGTYALYYNPTTYEVTSAPVAGFNPDQGVL